MLFCLLKGVLPTDTTHKGLEDIMVNAKGLAWQEKMLSDLTNTWNLKNKKGSNTENKIALPGVWVGEGVGDKDRGVPSGRQRGERV